MNITWSYHPQTNTYQAIVITDGIFTSTLFTHTCGNIEWSTIGRQPAVVGYNAGGDFYENHRSSGFDTIGFDVSCVIQLGQTKRQTEETNTMEMEIQTNEQLLATIMECEEMLVFDKTIFRHDVEIQQFADTIACPPSLSQVQNDLQFRVDETAMGDCYIQTLMINGTTPFEFPYEYGEQCCYDQAGYAVLEYQFNRYKIILHYYFLTGHCI